MHILFTALALAAQPAPAATPVSAPASAEQLFVDRDTPIRLMVLNEVSSRDAAPGTRFVLRVNEPVVVDGVTIVPAGAKAWGEVLSAESSGNVGKAGRLRARLLHLESGGRQIPITGENDAAGQGGGTQVALGALALGPLALFARGNNAKLKAGDMFTAYFAGDLNYDRTSATLSPVPAP